MEFSVDWLPLREPADRVARNPDLMAKARRAAGPAPTIVDLGCGTGAMRRALEGHGGTGISWRLVDNDPSLLERARAGATEPVETILLDLDDVAALPLDGASLVTASALLDLVSLHWMERLVGRLAQGRVPFLAVLNYDGRMRWDPPHELDDAITAAFNAHQQRDKGLGPAMGAEAAATAAQVFRDWDYTVATADSTWSLTPAEAPLQEMLLHGIADAATEAGAAQASTWLTARLAALPQTHARIGHTDLLANAPAPTPPEGG